MVAARQGLDLLPTPVFCPCRSALLSKKSIDFDHEIIENEKKLALQQSWEGPCPHIFTESSQSSQSPVFTVTWLQQDRD
jgi:hypothetical protein